ncbi:MAG: hypothetical protein KR126chlam6_00152 [Candidatus Anoxychlamydiales bacterium]|nr:hypothetical protein [Candidatus Anoxychlamydiales bacterium]
MATHFPSIQRSSNSSSSQNLQFVHVSKKSQIEEIFQARMQDLSMFQQDKLHYLIDKIEKGSRMCELLLDQSKPVGILVYKQKTKDNNFVVKTFFLIDKNDTQEEYRSSLLNRIIEIAKEKKAEKICVKLKQCEKETSSFFESKNIKAINTEVGDVKHYVLNLQNFVEKQDSTNGDGEKSQDGNRGIKRKKRPEQKEDDFTRSQNRHVSFEYPDFNVGSEFERRLTLMNIAVFLQIRWEMK